MATLAIAGVTCIDPRPLHGESPKGSRSGFTGSASSYEGGFPFEKSMAGAPGGMQWESPIRSLLDDQKKQLPTVSPTLNNGAGVLYPTGSGRGGFCPKFSIFIGKFAEISL
jgi:hypothetical protein